MSRQTRTGRVLGGALLSALAFLFATSVTQAAPASMTRVEHEAFVGGGNLVFVNDFEAGDGTQPWLAVGYVVDSDGARNPTAWSSADGVTWTRHAMPDTGSPERRDGPMVVERREGVTVAVGNRFEGSLRAAAWWSTAPGTWNAVPVADPLAAYAGIVEGVDVGPDAFYAAGYRHVGSRNTVTVFRSTDGRSWTEYSSFSTPANESLTAMDIAVSDSRMVVVAGSQSSTGENDTQIWVRTNGTWSSVDPTGLDMAGAGFQFGGAVAWHPAHGFVAGGISAVGNTDSPTLWYSATGATWERLPILSGGPAGVHRVIATPGGFLAAGLADAGPRVWRSGDGRNWSAVPTPASRGLQGGRARVGSDGTKILYSVTRDSGSLFLRLDGTEWKRADSGAAFPKPKPTAAYLLDVAVSKGRVLAIGSDGDGKPLVMSSTGGGWQRMPFADKAARLVTLTASRGVFTMAGWRLVRGRAQLAFWTSKNGKKWRAIGGTRRDPVGAFEEITRSSSGLLALALEPGQRGFVSTVWAPKRGVWLPTAFLGSGIPRAICAGPHGAVAVTTTGTDWSRVHVWTRPPKGRWSKEPDLLATNSLGLGCADGPRGTVVVGIDRNRAGVAWRRAGHRGPWTKRVLGSSSPLTEVLDVIPDGSGFLASGISGDRGQGDLAIWRSPDGTQWTRLGGADPVSLESGFQAGYSVVRSGGGRIVVVGVHGAGNAGLWTGTP